MAESVKIARIYLSENEKHDDENLYKVMFARLHDHHQIQGVTVYRGVAGFGSGGEVHSSDLLYLNADLPLVIELFDRAERIDAALADVATHLPAGRILCWTTQRD